MTNPAATSPPPRLAARLAPTLNLDLLCEELLPEGREEISWATMASVLVIARLCEPSSELHIAEDWYKRTALQEILGLPPEKVNDDRLYRALDQLLPHKEKIEGHLKARFGELFKLEYDLLLYDVTSTYFEGLAGRVWCMDRGMAIGHKWASNSPKDSPQLRKSHRCSADFSC